MSSELADLNTADEDDNNISGLSDENSTRATSEKDTLDAKDLLTRSAAQGGEDEAQNPSSNHGSALGSDIRDGDDRYEPAFVASSRMRLSHDKTFWARDFTVQHDILLKLTLLPCLNGLKDAMTMDPEAQHVKHMQENAKFAVKLAVSCNAPPVTLARCHFYQALVNMSVGVDTADSKAESPAYLLDQVKDVEDCVERHCAEQWLAKLEGLQTSTAQKTDNRRSLGQRVVSWGVSMGASVSALLSPYKSTPEKPGPTTKEDPVAEKLKRTVEIPTATNPPAISHQSPTSEAPESARSLISPVTPPKQKTRTIETPESRTSQTSRPLSDLFELTPESSARENLANISISDSQSQSPPPSRFSMTSNPPNSSPTTPYPLRHRVDGNGSPTPRFSSLLPAPNTSTRKHNHPTSRVGNFLL
ncbi:hypothetical protein AC578_4723 [Pseudocercospora eumusae]|uniref:Uncharacterized protein n=1 Tax=Pseudocercospora eumusae TaxID=321146 RepID=A0A139GZ49_9PEZI|nr:hypothetical protein AC578_4723 [Pseudocercospora eumusae]